MAKASNAQKPTFQWRTMAGRLCSVLNMASASTNRVSRAENTKDDGR